MWRLSLDIVGLTSLLVGGVMCVFWGIRFAWSEAELLSKDFFKIRLSMKIVWIGIMALIAFLILLSAWSPF